MPSANGYSCSGQNYSRKNTFKPADGLHCFLSGDSVVGDS